MGKSVSKFIAPVVDTATAIFAPELLPVVAPAVGAVTGGISGGGKGALIGGLEGLVGGQLGGVGPLAPFSSGTESLGSQILSGIGNAFGGAAPAAAEGLAGGGGFVEPALAASGTVGSAAAPALSGATALGAGAGGAAAAVPSFGSDVTSNLFQNLGENATPSLGQGIGTGAGGGGLSDLATAPQAGAADLSGGVPLGIQLGGVGQSLQAGAANTAPVPPVQAAASVPAAPSLTDKLLKYGGLGLNAAGLAKAALSPSKIPQQGNLESQAAQLDATGKQLTSALQTGQLPPGAENAIKQGVEAQKANIRSQFASMGLSGSSSEIQALSQVEQQAAAQKFQIANSLLQSGLNATGQANTVYNQLAQYKLQQDQQLQDALASFANSLAGGSNRVAA